MSNAQYIEQDQIFAKRIKPALLVIALDKSKLYQNVIRGEI